MSIHYILKFYFCIHNSKNQYFTYLLRKIKVLIQENKSSYKWIVLTVFTAVAGVSQMLWLNFAPLITQLMEKYNKSEGTISWLILVFPLLYVILSIPSGIMIDKKGYKFTVGLGSIIIAFFSILRIFESNFYLLLIVHL